MKAYLAGHTHIGFALTYNDILFVTTASTSVNHDSSPLGFRLWRASASAKASLEHEYVTLLSFYEGRDTDGDGLDDGDEDVNKNNIVDPGETDRHNADTDGDGLSDGVERTFGTDPLSPDATEVPTLSVWGLVSIVVALAGLAALRLPSGLAVPNSPHCQDADRTSASR